MSSTNGDVPALRVESAPAALNASTASLDSSTPLSPSSNVSVTSAHPSYNKELLIEIVSCRNLLPVHKSGFSNPYVKIRFGTSDKHKTSYIEKTLNPSFLPQHKNTYILKASPKEVYNRKGIQLIVKDHDTFGINDDIGVATVSAEELYLAEGQDKEIRLEPPKGSKHFANGELAGFITIRVREATRGDKDQIKDRSSLLLKAKNKITSPRMVRFHYRCISIDCIRLKLDADF